MIKDAFAGFDKIKHSAKKALLFTKFSYKTSPEDLEYLNRVAQKIAPDHQLLLFSDFFDDTKKFEYRCAVFISHKTKKIVFANAGTRLNFNMKGFSDIRDDLNLLRNLPPKKLKSASLLNTIILDNLGQYAKDFKFCYIGHSLGAAMADFSAVDMELQLLSRKLKAKKISTITFENPGTKPLIQQMLKNQDLNEFVSSIDHITINNRDNFINTFNPQVGRVFKVISDQPRKLGYFENLISSVAQSIVKSIECFAPSCITTVCRWISFGSFSRQVQEHRLFNFEDVILYHKGEIKSLDSLLVSQNLTEMKYDKKTFANLEVLKIKNKDIGKKEFVMRHEVTNQEIEFSNLEFSKASNELRFQKIPSHTISTRGI